MQSITVNLSDDHSLRLIVALCGLHNYEAESQETGETQNQFAQRKIREWLKDQARRWEKQIAQQAAIDGLTEIEIT
jgi:hypothetical protein